MAPSLRFQIDEKTTTLRMTADPKLLGIETIDLSSNRDPPNISHTKERSAFLNYGLNLDMGDGSRVESFRVPLELGISLNEASAVSNFSYTDTKEDADFVRLFTHLTRDNKLKNQRLIIGDFNAASGTLGGGSLLGGVSLSSSFAHNPGFIRHAMFDFSEFLFTPSDVEVYVGGHLIQKREFAPGRFSLMNIPSVVGPAEATVVITDSFGRKNTRVIPFYTSSSLLKPGLSEYGYHIGFKRESFNEKSNEYGDPVLIGSHRIGVNKNFTYGMRAEIEQEQINVGLSSAVPLLTIGEIDSAVAVSNADGIEGYAFQTNLSARLGKIAYTRFSANLFSREYAHLNLSPSQDRSKLNATFSISAGHTTAGSFSATWNYTKPYVADDSSRVSLTYSRLLIKNLPFFVNVSRSSAETVTYDLFAGVNFIFGERQSGSLSHQQQAKSATDTINIQKSPPLGTGLGYQIGVTQSQGEDTTRAGNGFLTLRGPYGLYSSSLRTDFLGTASYNVDLSGGVAFINGGVYFARPISDSFALVKVSDLDHIRVYYSGQLIGETHHEGRLLIPHLASYLDNNISIEEKDIPIFYEMKSDKQRVAPPLRGGRVVAFELVKRQAIMGHFFFVEKGQKEAAEYAGLEIKLPEKSVEEVVGKGGEFYLENLPSGELPARLFKKGKECLFNLVIPKNNTAMIDLGEVQCEIR